MRISGEKGDTPGVLVEVHTLFRASDRDEAEALLDQVIDAELAVVCPPDKTRLTTCSNCEGSLVNPSTDTVAGEAGDNWLPGLPCAVCTGTGHPGREMGCAREHVCGATLHLDGNWITAEDRRLTAFLRALIAALDTGDIEAVRAQVDEKLRDLIAGN